MPYSVRVRPQHPTGHYRRAGFDFTTNEDLILDDTQMTEQLARDPWLVIRPMGDTSATLAAPGDVLPAVRVPDWLFDLYGGDLTRIEADLAERTGVFGPPAEMVHVPPAEPEAVAEPEPEAPKRTRRKATEDAEPEFGPPVEG